MWRMPILRHGRVTNLFGARSTTPGSQFSGHMVCERGSEMVRVFDAKLRDNLGLPLKPIPTPTPTSPAHTSTPTPTKAPQRRRCFNCGKWGHMARVYWAAQLYLGHMEKGKGGRWHHRPSLDRRKAHVERQRPWAKTIQLLSTSRHPFIDE